MTTPTDRRAEATPGLDPTNDATPEVPPPLTADEVSVPPPDRAPHTDDTTDVALTFERG